MLGQTFETGDIASIAALVLLEGLLSADNALVLAIMVRHLPKAERQRALLYGLGGAFGLRLGAILLASYVLHLWWLQAIGALYLLSMPIKHFISHTQGKKAKPVGGSFWMTVLMVELTDVAFAVDSVLAGVSFVDNERGKIWVVYTGAMIGILLLRFAAGVFIKLLDRYPVFDHVAYVLVGWVGAKLAVLAAHSVDRVHPAWIDGYVPEMHPGLFWSVLALIIIVGAFFAVRMERSPTAGRDEDAENVQEACRLRRDPS